MDWLDQLVKRAVNVALPDAALGTFKGGLPGAAAATLKMSPPAPAPTLPPVPAAAPKPPAGVAPRQPVAPLPLDQPPPGTDSTPRSARGAPTLAPSPPAGATPRQPEPAPTAPVDWLANLKADNARRQQQWQKPVEMRGATSDYARPMLPQGRAMPPGPPSLAQQYVRLAGYRPGNPAYDQFRQGLLDLGYPPQQLTPEFVNTQQVAQTRQWLATQHRVRPEQIPDAMVLDMARRAGQPEASPWLRTGGVAAEFAGFYGADKLLEHTVGRGDPTGLIFGAGLDAADRAGVLPEWLGGNRYGPLTSGSMYNRLNEGRERMRQQWAEDSPTSDGALLPGWATALPGQLGQTARLGMDMQSRPLSTVGAFRLGQNEIQGAQSTYERSAAQVAAAARTLLQQGANAQGQPLTPAEKQQLMQTISQMDTAATETQRDRAAERRRYSTGHR